VWSQVEMCLLYRFEAALYGLTNLRLGLVADSRVEKSFMRFFELDTETNVLPSQLFEALSR